MIRFVALGTSATFPTENRNHPGFYLEYKGVGILFDCGEGIQRQFRKVKLSPTKLKYIFLTHWHGDHVLGLPGILFNLANSEYKKELTIFVPKGYKKKIYEAIEAFDIPINFGLNVKEVEEGKILEDEEFYVKAIYVKHSIPTVAYFFKQKDYWRLKNEKLKEYGLFGKHKLLDKLKKHGKIIYKNKEIKINEVGYLKKGFKFTYITDTIYLDKLIEFSENSDILLIESTYFFDKEKAKEHMHLDFEEAKKIFKKSNSNIMLITHVSQRYEDSLEELRKKIKDDTIFILSDFDSFKFEKNIIELKIDGKIYRFLRDEITGKIKKLD